MKRVIVALFCVLSLTGCASESVNEDVGDIKDSDPVDVVRLRTPSDYNDVVAFCDGTNRVYLSSNDALFVVPNDTACGYVG